MHGLMNNLKGRLLHLLVRFGEAGVFFELVFRKLLKIKGYTLLPVKPYNADSLLLLPALFNECNSHSIAPKE
jgi:hypothetical protein